MKLRPGNTVSGLKWSLLSQVGRYFVQLLSVFILARLLAPKDFGLIGMAMVVIGFAMLFRDIGTAAAIIQRKQLSRDLLNSLFWVNLLIGITATAAIAFSANFIAEIYGEPQVAALLRIMGLVFVITGSTTIFQALMERAMNFMLLARIELIAAFSGAALGVYLGWHGLGAWSIAWQTLSTAIVRAILLLASSNWRPGSGPILYPAFSVGKFSLNLTGFNIFNYFARNADAFLIGKYVGAQALGFYSASYQVMLAPLQIVTGVVSRVFFPAYSRIQDNNAVLRRMYISAVGGVAFLTFPLMTLIMATSDLLVPYLLGSQWQAASILISILAPVGMLQSVIATVGPLYQAKGRTDILFVWGIISGLITIASFAAGLPYGAKGVAIAYACATVLLAYPNFRIPLGLIDLPIATLLRELSAQFLSSLTSLSVLMALRIFVTDKWTPTPRILFLVSVGALIYIIMEYFMDNKRICRFWRALPGI